MNAPDDATLRQITAADPARSTWLSANAGSGKTRVLTDRVARLLLGGTLPQHILCLTYTKAAASEMQNRLFARLGDWAMKDDAALRTELAGLGVHDTDAARLADARTLFARAIETPGGLRIQTIHSFCASILRRFPLEAGVSPQFTEIEDHAARLLRADVVETIADGPDSPVIDMLARFYTGADFAALTAELGKWRDAFSPARSDADIMGWFGLPADFDPNLVLSDCFLGGEAALFARIIPLIAASGKSSDTKLATTLAALNMAGPGFKELQALETVFLFGETAKNPFGAKIDTIPTKECRATLGDDLELLNQLMARIEQARSRRLALLAAQKTIALHRFAGVFLPAYEARKAARGMLDFDDLILRARHLLTDTAVAQWVLYRLDGGIDHILVDEAQDTSPEQWRVIQTLAAEFTSGDAGGRTIFVVGDLKQSIYSFQGADPAEFGRMRRLFGENLAAVGRDLGELSLEYSFRSSAAVLSLVDAAFDRTGGKGVGGATLHHAFFANMPGRVDLWPPEADDKTAPAKPDWQDPVDIEAPDHPNVRLAARIAGHIADLLKNGSIPDKQGSMRRITPGDFLILVQRRSGIFAHIIAACKKAGIEIAGADRLRLGAELAVRDIAATLQFLATPDDDLSLAAALRSPLFGWSERQLYDLAHHRHEDRLWRALSRRQDDFPQTYALLRDLRDRADYLRPYDLIERLLIVHDGRRKLTARLGDEAADGIDVLLAQALAYERSDIPSLTGFLDWLDADDVEVKRQLDSAGDQVRVMTVHGAKGLEAPIVILPDTAKRAFRLRQEIVMMDGQAVWKTPEDDAPPPMAKALQSLRDAAEEESRRLLYVALTRAETWLIVCAAGEVGKDQDSWHAIVQGGMIQAGAQAHDFDGAQGLRLQHGDWSGAVHEAPGTTPALPQLPHWAALPAPRPPEPVSILAPSALGGAKALFGEGGLDEESALRRGRQLHRLLEFLPAYPPTDWPRIAAELLAAGEDAATPPEVAELLAEAGGVLNSDDLRFLFGPDALAEIDLAAPLPQLRGARMRGTIDRLIITPDRVLAVDFKSNAVVPPHIGAVPDGLLRQMGAYAAALAQIYPGRAIETALLWTRNATLMPLPHDAVMAALLRAGHLDPATPGS